MHEWPHWHLPRDGWRRHLIRQLGGEVQFFAANRSYGTGIELSRLSREFGLLVGTSSGANITAALRTACDLPPTAKVVTILCDRAERYYSTKLFAEPPAP